jgi:ubiquitin-conjugating enzyme E2 variant
VRPFRVHHLNPDDFLLRDFVDTNGDVSMLLVPILYGTSSISPSTALAASAVTFAVAFAAAAVLTNQVHQWAHMRCPPRGVAWLQRRGIILGRAAHERHHAPPFARDYCIATGWLNRPLAAVSFFPRAERLVTAVTGLRPRLDDAAFCGVSDRP